MKKLFLAAVSALVLLSFTANASLSNKINYDKALEEEYCGIDCIGLAFNIGDDVDLTFDEFEAIINTCEAINLIGCN